MNIDVRGPVTEAEAAAVLALAGAAAVADGVGPLSEQVRLGLQYGGDHGSDNLLLWHDGALAGYAQLAPPAPGEDRSGELVVHPSYRGRGAGKQLAAALVAAAGPAEVRVWAHGDLPAAARLAKAAGFTRVRALWRMLRNLRAEPAERPPLPPGVSLRTFVPGQDEDAWLAMNARAFATHPEQGRWTGEDLGRREREPWFDPAGFFLAERDGHPVGFHWTKIHQPQQPGDSQLGEVYVLGVDPAGQGTGLGRVLTQVGLYHLASRGVPAVMLYVDEDNTAAIRLYQSLAFTHTSTDVMYQHTPTRSRGISLGGIALSSRSGAATTP
ncbi:MAG TPA: mycothiol synthase [Streptosporangiaceae bacterium]